MKCQQNSLSGPGLYWNGPNRHRPAASPVARPNASYPERDDEESAGGTPMGSTMSRACTEPLRIRRGCIKPNQWVRDPGMDVQKPADFRAAPIPALLGAGDQDVLRWFIL